MWFVGECPQWGEAARWPGGWVPGLAMAGFAAAAGAGVVLRQVGAGVVLLFDGRVDEAAALRRELGIAVEGEEDIAGLVVAAYGRWGEDFPAHVLGDYAFALWDGRVRRLLLGRDAAGARPLYFCERAESLFFSSEARLLLEVAGVRPVVNERRVAEWLGVRFHAGDETFFAGVHALRAGDVLVWEDGRRRVRTFWHPELVATLRLRDAREYAEAARAVLYRAVARRLPAGRRMGAHLSGGLDSSTVADTAARLLAREGRELTAFTAVPEVAVDAALFPGRFTDETEFARTVAAPHGNVRHALVGNHAVSLFGALDALSDAMERPMLNPGNGVWMSAILQEARRRGVEVLLDGTMSNFTFSYDGQGALPALLQRGRLVAAGRLAAAYHRHDARWRHVAALGVLPLLPKGLRLWVDRVGRGQATLSATHGTGGSEAFLRQFAAGNADVAAHDVVDGRLRRIALIGGIESETHMMMARSAGLEDLSPTADREVLEFCFAVPEEQFVVGGDRRALIRNMMTGLLPERVLRERRKGLQAADAFPLMLAARAEMAAELAAMREVDVVRRAIDLPRMDALMERWPATMRSSADYVAYCVALPRAISMGRFLRRMEQGQLFSTRGPELAAAREQVTS